MDRNQRIKRNILKKEIRQVVKTGKIGILPFLKKIKAKTICEIGVDKGRFIKNMALCEPDLIVGIDPWNHEKIAFYDSPLDKLKIRYKKILQWAGEQQFKVKIIRDYSINAVKLFPDKFFDFIYIDADHSYEAIKQDLKIWWPKTKKPGIIAGHDYKKGAVSKRTKIRYGIYEAINEFVHKKKIKKNLYITIGGMLSFLIIK